VPVPAEQAHEERPDDHVEGAAMVAQRPGEEMPQIVEGARMPVLEPAPGVVKRDWEVAESGQQPAAGQRVSVTAEVVRISDLEVTIPLPTVLPTHEAVVWSEEMEELDVAEGSALRTHFRGRNSERRNRRRWFEAGAPLDEGGLSFVHGVVLPAQELSAGTSLLYRWQDRPAPGALLRTQLGLQEHGSDQFSSLDGSQRCLASLRTGWKLAVLIAAGRRVAIRP